MNLIILTPEQSDQVRGPSDDGGAALSPRETANGNFILPDRVLRDPKHASHHDMLSSLPVANIAEVEFPVAEEDI